MTRESIDQTYLYHWFTSNQPLRYLGDWVSPHRTCSNLERWLPIHRPRYEPIRRIIRITIILKA